MEGGVVVDEVAKQETPRRRRTPAEKARDERAERCREAVAKLHPGEVECVFSLWGPEMYVAVWQDGKCIGNYEYQEED